LRKLANFLQYIGAVGVQTNVLVKWVRTLPLALLHAAQVGDNGAAKVQRVAVFIYRNFGAVG